MNTDSDPRLVVALAIVVLVLMFAIPLSIARWFVRRSERRQRGRAEANQLEAEAFFQHLAAIDGVETVETSLILGVDEQAVLVDGATLFETRAFRTFGGAGTSVRGIHLGAGASEAHDRLRQIDSGTLVLTTKRLVFDGSRENRSIKLADILSAEALLDAIEVSTQRQGKSMLFAVPNPLIWAPMIKAVASRR